MRDLITRSTGRRLMTVDGNRRPGGGTGGLIARIVGVFAVIGLCLGLGTVFGLWGFGVFDGQEGDLGAAIMGAFTLVGAYLFVVMVGVVIAALGGHYAARAARSDDGPILAAGAGGALGHLALLATFTLVVAAGFAVLSDDTGTSDGGETGAADDGVPAMDVLWKVALASIPAGIVGVISAKLFARRPTASSGTTFESPGTR